MASLYTPVYVPTQEVSFDLDSNGILNVGASDQGTGTSEKMISASVREVEMSILSRAAKQTGGFPDLDLSFLFCPFSSFMGLL